MVLRPFALDAGGVTNRGTLTLSGPNGSLPTTTAVTVNPGATLVLDNTAGVNNARIAAGATTWVFPSSFVAGSSYSVTVQTQPAGELCEVTSGGSGMHTGDVGNVTVVCGFGQWSWEGGLNAVNASGAYGTQGVASASNVPGARQAASSWTDASGDFLLFGGVGYDSTGDAGYLNDLWQYSPSANAPST